MSKGLKKAYMPPTIEKFFDGYAKSLGVSNSKAINLLVKEKMSKMPTQEKERLINLSKEK